MNLQAPVLPSVSGFLAERTMAQVLSRLATVEGLSASRRRDLSSAVRRYCHWQSLPPESVSAAPEHVRAELADLHPRICRVAPKTLDNVKSNLVIALRVTRTQQSGPRPALTLGWQGQLDRVGKVHDRWPLHRFARFCSARGIAPFSVDCGVLQAFAEAVQSDPGISRPRRLLRMTLHAWNRLAGTEAALQALPAPGKATGYAIPWADLPTGLREDADRWLERLAEPSLLDPLGPPEPMSEATLKVRAFQIRQLVGALRQNGFPIERLTGLADLVEPATAEMAIRFFLARNANRTSSQISGLANLVLQVAKHWAALGEADLRQLSHMRSRLTLKQSGLTDKNRLRLAQFDDPRNIEALLLLPARVFERLRRKSGLGAQDRAVAQVAVMLELLLMAPVRRRNLITLRHGPGGHLRWIGSGRNRRLRLMIPEHETKNRHALDYPLPAETADLIALYFDRIRPGLNNEIGSWLFPGALPGRHIALDHATRNFTRVVQVETGLIVNLHLMRHIGARLYLDAHPGQYEVVRRVLAHKALKTTVTSYTGTETDAAIRQYDNVILGIRADVRSRRESDSED